MSDTVMKKTRVAIIGCGNIAGPYSTDIKKRPSLEIAGYSDIDQARAQQFASEHGGKAYANLEEVLADPSVDVIVNLTIFQAHYEVVKAALNAGKHAYSEKPLALKTSEALELVQIARAKNLKLGCAPITFLGEAQQTAMKLIREGKIGTPRVVYAEVNHGRIESWHPNPAAFYEVGPNLDVGVYPLALTTSLFGRVKQLTAFARTLHPNRVRQDGEPFTVSAPDFYVVNLEFDGVDGQPGPLVRLTTNFYVSGSSMQGEGIEFHGDVGSLYLHSWFMANSKLEYADFGKPYEVIPLVAEAEQGLDWSRGLHDFCDALQNGTRSRVTGDQAAHVVEILSATDESARTGQTIVLKSTFEIPAPMDFAK